MGVYIKGMKMPKRCFECPMYREGYERPNRYCYCAVSSAETRRFMTKQPTDCPLIELPDHGDLIDRDALNVTDSWDWIRHDAPVVIPAERSEE